MEMLDGMIFGENPRNGFVEEGQFVHPDLEFQFPVPDGWQAINQTQQVVLVSPQEDAIIIFSIDSESMIVPGVQCSSLLARKVLL